MNNWICGLIAVVAVFAIAGAFEGDDLDAEQKHYCHMTQIYKDTKGNFGWPEFKGPCEVKNDYIIEQNQEL